MRWGGFKVLVEWSVGVGVGGVNLEMGVDLVWSVPDMPIRGVVPIPWEWLTPRSVDSGRQGNSLT